MAWSFLASKAGIGCIVALVIAGAFGFLTLQLRHVQHDLKNANDQIVLDRSALKDANDKIKLSEANRKDEFTTAKLTVVNSNKACDARVAAARKSAVAIKGLTEKCPVLDQTHCLAPARITAGELRDTLK